MKTIKLVFACIIIFLFASKEVGAQKNFDFAKDMLLANFDLKPDEDDVHSAAALACMLQHPDFSGINYYVVAGAYGEQDAEYITSATPGYFNDIFGLQNQNWTDAHRDRTGSLDRVVSRVVSVLKSGGKVFVQEAGQSNFTYDVLQKVLLNAAISLSDIKERVIIVQHGIFNENQTIPSKLNWLKTNTDYVKINTGNSGGNGTPDYNSGNAKWLSQAKSASNPNALARLYWTKADEVCDNWNGRHSNTSINKGGVDFSDYVENWWIFDLGNKADGVKNFWNEFVTNNLTTSESKESDEAAIEENLAFNETNGYVIIEAESAVGYADKGFELKSNKVGSSDPTGTGYLRATFRSMREPNAGKTISYQIKINKIGTYRFLWRNVRDPEAESGDAGNDSWLNIKGDGSRFYGVKKDKEYTLTKPTKTWVQKSNFVYECNGEAHIGGAKVNGMQYYVTFSKPGMYKIEVSPRSIGHCIDRLVLFMDDKKNVATNPDTAESTKVRVNVTSVKGAKEDIGMVYMSGNKLYFDGVNNGGIAFKVFDLNGMLVDRGLFYGTTSSKEINLPRGFYIVKVGQIVKKIYIQ